MYYQRSSEQGDGMSKGRRTIRGEDHDLVVFQVLSRDAHGRPRQVVALYDEESTDIKGGEEFVTAFVKSKVVEKRS
jgi:hypothetical protein